MTQCIIYKEGEKIKATTPENYHAIIQDANKIIKFDDFTSLQQAKEYIKKYSKLTDQDIKIVDENRSY